MEEKNALEGGAGTGDELLLAGAGKSSGGRPAGSRFSPLRYELNKIPNGDEPSRTSALISVLLEEAVRTGASDIHFDAVASSYEVRYRVDGSLGEPTLLKQEDGLHLVRSLKSRAGLDPGYALKPLSGRTEIALSSRALSIRVATAPGLSGEKLALRLLPPSFAKLSLGELGLSPRDSGQLRGYALDARGMMLVSGPTGAGKTTTVYALLQELKGSNRSVVSIEDPVEYLIPGITQMQVNEKQGLTFAEGIKGILRLDPDVIMMGEMRDRTSAECALDAAESGHVVISTMHARDAAGTLTVLRNFGFTDHEIAATVDLIVAQRLVRRLCPACRCQKPLTEEEETLLRSCGIALPKQLWHPQGCHQCDGTGYRGRVGVFELHRLNEQDADLILGHVDEHTFRQHLRRHGAAPLFEDILRKAADGITSLTELQAMGGFSFYVQQTP